MVKFFQSLLPQHLLSRITGSIANCRCPRVKNFLISQFIKHFNVDVTEADPTDPRAYENFNSFFTRALKKGARPIADGDHVIVSPVDGFVSQLGEIHHGRLLQAKGITYELTSLLAGINKYAEALQEGRFISLYLSPKDYHRVHMPTAGNLVEMIYVPGKLFSVNPVSVREIPQLYVRNERVINLFTTAAGPMVVIMIGAMLVASIATVWHGVVTSSKSRQVQHWHYPKGEVMLERGQEMGRFQYGSSVIVLFPAGVSAWESVLSADMPIKMGMKLGELIIRN